MKKIRIGVTAFVAILVLLIVGIGNWFYFSSSKPILNMDDAVTLKKLTIGTAPWPGFYMLNVAQDQGFFREEGLEVKLTPFLDTPPKHGEFIRGDLDAIAVVTYEFFRNPKLWQHGKYTLTTDYSSGADAVIARKGITSIADCRTFAMVEGFELIVDATLHEIGRTENDVTFTYVGERNIIDTLQSGEADCAPYYEPFTSDYVITYGGTILKTSADFPHLITDGLIFSNEALADTDLMQRFTRAYLRAITFAENYPEEAAKSGIALIGGASYEEFQEIMTTIDVLTRDELAPAIKLSNDPTSIRANIHQLQTLRPNEKHLFPENPEDYVAQDIFE